jgi:outer membrane lipase/esterase
MKKLALSVCGLAMLFSSVASASSFDQIYVFGDSLSDNGNAALALGTSSPLAPLPPNYNGSSYTDGIDTVPSTTGPLGLWIDQFAAKIGVADPQPFLAGGTNYAVASAETGSSSQQDMGNQVGAYFSAHPSSDPNALYVFFGGANDLLDSSPTADPSTVAGTAVGHLAAEIQLLIATGAKHILWFNVPAVVQTPAAAAGGAAYQTFLQAASQDFNADWSAELAGFKNNGVDIDGVDVHGLMQNIVADPSAYGFTNVTTPAQGIASVNPNNYLFWDAEHPTTAGDALIADAAMAALPEPNCLAVLGAGMLLFISRRQAVAK